MKIAFILILHLGLVACGNNATNTSLQCERCHALEELTYYFFNVKDNANGSIFTGMLDQYLKQGLVSYLQKDKLEEAIADTYKTYGDLQNLAINAQSIIENEICYCNGVASKVQKCPKGITNTSTIFTHPPGLNSSAGPVVVNVQEFSCSNCKAIYKIQKYIDSRGDDRDGSIFWALIDRITDEGVLTPKERDHLKSILTLEYVKVCRGRNYDAGGEEVIKYINHKSPFRCCKNVGASGFLCTEHIPKLVKAILLIKDFINRNHQCPHELSTLIFNFYVEGSITLQRWNIFNKLIKDQLKEKPKAVAELVLKDLNYKNGIKKLEDYELEVNEDSNYDPQGTKIFELMREFKDEGLMLQGQYDQGLVLWTGNKINKDPIKMADYVRQMLISIHGH